MFEHQIGDLDADSTLTFVAETRAAADRLEGRLMEAAAHWADLNGPIDGRSFLSGRLPIAGTEQLIRLGGEGTPEVREFAPAELGAELGTSDWAAARLIGDALDLRHRLPLLWGRLLAGEVKPWIGRKCAEATRDLSFEVASAVDRRVARWAHSLSWGRLTAIIDAARIEADPDGAAAAAERAANSQGVWLGESHDNGIKDIFIRTETPNAIWFDATIDRIADELGRLGDQCSKEVRRGRAVGVLARPQLALDLFQSAATLGPAPVIPVEQRPNVTLYVHVTDETLAVSTADAPGGVARVERVGAVTADQVKTWLGDCTVSVKPVIDVAGQVAVDAYEIPDRLREAVHLRTPVDVFPFSRNTSSRMDLDHTEPYISPDSGGPPGQTTAANLGPMTRRHHRIKTHGRWRLRQPFPGIYVWRSPHDRFYVVDHTGTRRIPQSAA